MAKNPAALQIDESGTYISVATEAKLEAVRALIDSINAKDFSTEATLDAFLAAFNAEDFASQATLAALLAAFNAEDFSSETTLAALLAAFNAEDFASDTTLAAVQAALENKVDTDNSSVAQLAANADFTGPGTDVSQYATVAITVHSDKDSAVDGMRFEFSMDNSNWDDSYKFNLNASESQTRRFQFPVTAQYFRVRYTNGTTLTTEFRVQTILNRDNTLTSIHRIQDVVREDRSAQVMKSAIIAQREGVTIQDFYPIQADVSGNLKVTTIGSDIPSDPSAFVLEFCENGGSENMLVNGSVTPVAFERGPTITDEIWSIRELLLTFSADDFSFDGISFGPYGALSVGITIEILKDSIVTEVFRVKQNEDFLRVPGRTPLVNNTGPKDVLGAALSFDGLVLNQATGDLVRVTVRDALTGVKHKYLTATLFAVKVQ